jgi:hypothetical protein
MPSISSVARWEASFLMAGFFGLIAWKLFTGEIDLGQLFEGDMQDRSSADGFSSYVSAARVQSFLISIFTASYFLTQVLYDPTHFPDFSSGLVAALAGSQGLYLGGKAQAMLIGPLRDLFK